MLNAPPSPTPPLAHAFSTLSALATTMAHAHCKRSIKLKPRVSKWLTCTLEKIEKRGKLRARALHVQCAPVVRFLYSVAMPLS